MTDQELLATYLTSRDEPSFAALVSRYLPLVDAAARRQVREPGMAADVTQAVFILLAKKAPALSPQKSLAGWLLAATHYCARDALKLAQRRARHERAAAAMRPEAAQPAEPLWDDVAPKLDAAMARLSSADRTAVALRFLENRTLEEVGQSLGLTKDAAGKRISRALARLRKLLTRRGLALPAAALAAMLAAHPADAAVAHLSTHIAPAALHTTLAAQTPAALIAKGALHVMTLLKIKLALVTAAIVILTTTTAVIVTVKAQASAPEAAPATQPALSPKAAALLKAIKADINSFTLNLDYVGPEDKPFYNLYIGVPAFNRRRNDPVHLGASIDAKTAAAIADYLAASGFLDRASPNAGIDELRLDKNLPLPHYFAIVGYGASTLQLDLGWNLPMLAWLDGLKALLPQPSPADKDMQTLLDRLAGLREEWQKAGQVPQPDPHRITLKPSGVVVELLGLTSSQTPGKWWAIDGTPLPKPPDLSDQAQSRTNPPPEGLVVLQLLTRVVYPENMDCDIRLDVEKKATTGGFSSSVSARHEKYVLEIDNVFVPRETATTKLNIDIATGPWTAVVTSDGQWPTAGGMGKSLLAVSRAFEENGDSIFAINAVNWPTDVAYRFMTVDLAGQEHPGFTAKSMIRGSQVMEEVQFQGLPKARIKEFRFDVRPYDQRVEIENLSLQPGKITTPKITAGPRITQGVPPAP